MKKLLLCMSAMLFLLAGCNADTTSSPDDLTSTASADSSADANPDSAQDADANANPDSVSDQDIIIVTLYPDTAPITCENFESLVSEGFYNGLTFHRVVDDFMAQGGDPLGNGTGGSPETIKGEFSSNGVENNLSHQRGVISMARSSMNDSASSQFFICYADCSFLDGNYAAFGEVTQGMEIVDSFLNVPRSYNSNGELAVPDSPITMQEVTMIDPDENGNPRVQIVMDTIPVAE